MPQTRIDAGDAAELAEMLAFLSDWLAARPAQAGASLARYTGHPAYSITSLRADLDKFAFLLGGSDGEQPFGPQPASPCRDDNVTPASPAARCPVCTAAFTPVRRQQYCSPACKQKAYRARRPVPEPAPAPGPARRQASIYQCSECDERYLASQWCHDCNRPCAKIGYGGLCPGCQEPITITELLGQH
jgi:hypothetical protein